MLVCVCDSVRMYAYLSVCTYACVSVYVYFSVCGSVYKVHALNILRALYRDTRLSEDVFPYISDGVKRAVLGYASSHWMVHTTVTTTATTTAATITTTTITTASIAKASLQ